MAFENPSFGFAWKQLTIVIILLVLVVHDMHGMHLTNLLPNNNDQIVKEQNFNQLHTNGSVKNVPFIEYFMEHNVSQSDAKQHFFETGIKLLDDKPSPWCMQCDDQIINYCLGGKMLDDHCCCDSRHGQEKLPWIPHSCYIGDKCRPSTITCIRYTELRECCCDRVLAKRWKTIHSSSSKTSSKIVIQLTCMTALIYSRLKS